MEVTQRALHLRIRQQEMLTELGVLALKGTPFVELLDETAKLAAEGLQAEFCKVLEHLPAEKLPAGSRRRGLGSGVVGVARVGADLASPAGFALRTGKPVISNHLENEERFRTPELLVDQRYPPGHERDPAGRRQAVRRAGGRQPVRGRVRRA